MEAGKPYHFRGDRCDVLDVKHTIDDRGEPLTLATIQLHFRPNSKYVVDSRYLRRLWRSYPTFDQRDVIRKVAEEVRAEIKGDAKGKCIWASERISERLEDEHNIMTALQFGFFNNKQHCWIDVFFVDTKESHFLDVTADQFGDYPPVIFEPYDKYDHLIRWDEGAG